MSDGRHRRVRTPPAPGSDPAPQTAGPAADVAAEDDPRSWGDGERSGGAESNDEQLRRDVPPHWHADGDP